MIYACPRCHGRAVIEHPCTECGDSTWDHACNDWEEPCPDCAAKGLPAKIEAPPAAPEGQAPAPEETE